MCLFTLRTAAYMVFLGVYATLHTGRGQCTACAAVVRVWMVGHGVQQVMRMLDHGTPPVTEVVLWPLLTDTVSCTGCAYWTRGWHWVEVALLATYAVAVALGPGPDELESHWAGVSLFFCFLRLLEVRLCLCRLLNGKQ